MQIYFLGLKEKSRKVGSDLHRTPAAYEAEHVECA